MTRQKEEFITLHPMAVSMYVCGLTVYDEPHIGHGRTAVAFDVIMRYLRFRGYNVVFVRNITDIDDKIIKRAAEYGEPVESLVTRFIASMHRDFAALGTLPPDQEPRATTSIDTMIQLIIQLIQQDAAYVTAHGDVYYRVSSFKSYGKLSNQHTEQLRSGVRILPDEHKQDPLDFALWKTAKAGEPSWSSPWGYGRPGWHIECSAMSTKYLGAEFDIHGGGMDLIPTHHTNEIAQNIACNHAQPAKFWMHTNMLTVNGQKMSKSLGNSFLPNELFSGNHELLEKGYSPMAVRFFMLQAHYRSTLDFSNEALQAAEKGLTRLFNASNKLSNINFHSSSTVQINDLREKLYEAMNEDFNTPMVIAHLFEGVKLINLLEEGKEKISAQDLDSFTKTFNTFLFEILGLKSEQTGSAEKIDELMEIILQIRSEAKARKDFTSSDEIRERLKSIGIEIKDNKEGTTFQVA